MRVWRVLLFLPRLSSLEAVELAIFACFREMCDDDDTRKDGVRREAFLPLSVSIVRSDLWGLGF